MSSALFFLVPLGVLAVAWSLCFVGCVLNTHGEGNVTPYSNQILGEQGLIAYWPLSDLPGQTTPPPPPTPQGSIGIGSTIDLSNNGHTGGYLNPPAYQAGTTIPQIANPTLNLRQTSIVPGDVSNSNVVDQNLIPACVDFEGGYVNIAWANSPDLTDFTLEAWIVPKWNVNQFTWVVFDAQTANAGFGLYIDTSNQWVLSVGDGITIQTINTMVPAAVNGIPSYVAVTFDSSTQALSLWINPQSQSDASNPPPPTPTWTPPNPTTYVAIDSTQPATFFIGAGATQLPLRTQDMGSGGPVAPFQGLIQDVALYNKALSGTTLQSHFLSGAG